MTSATMRFLVPRAPEESLYRRELLERAQTDRTAWPLVDSGRLAEPYWYDASPLTTPHATRIVPGRPARGSVLSPAPGVLVPDCPTGKARLRELARRGLSVLAGGRVDARALELQLDATAHPPIGMHRVEALDPNGELATTLGLQPQEVWVLRPDAHIAAILDAPARADVVSALRRAYAAV